MDASSTSSTFSAGSTTADSAVRREMAAASGRIARVKRIDRAAVGLITLGGVLVVVSVIGILVFIASEALPLFRSASATKIGTFTVGAARPPVSVGTGADELGRYVYDITDAGVLSVFSADGGAGAAGARQAEWRNRTRGKQVSGAC